mgnify:CR=1 FL=1
MAHKPIFTTCNLWETTEDYNNRIAKACTLIGQEVISTRFCSQIWIDGKLEEEMGYDLVRQIGGFPKFTSEAYHHFPCLVIDMNNKKRECIVYVGKDEYLRNYNVIRLASDIAPTNDEFRDGKVRFFRHNTERR